MTLDPTIKGEKLDHEWGFFVFRGEVLESEITTTLFTLYRNILREKTLTETPYSTYLSLFTNTQQSAELV